MVSGIINNGPVSDAAWFYNVAAGAWFDGGPIATGGYYRTAAATLFGEVYKISGSIGSFTYSGISDRNISGSCPLCSDLAVTKDNGVAQVSPGDPVTYIITVDNFGPNPVFGAAVEDLFPPEFTGASWTCAGTPGAICSPSGTGDIIDIVDIPVGGQLVYQATGVVAGAGMLSNSVEVFPPADIVEIDPMNNFAIDEDPIVLPSDAWITKYAGYCAYLPGDTINYTIRVGNDGPYDIVGAIVEDFFPPELLGVSWTCTPTAGASCTASGSGNISDAVDIPVGGLVVYSITATIDSSASGQVTNQAAVTAIPFDPNPANNVWIDHTALDMPIFCDGFESGDSSAWSTSAP
jgi:uncharacterized repeat protein (TIGR01451 family)